MDVTGSAHPESTEKKNTLKILMRLWNIVEWFRITGGNQWKRNVDVWIAAMKATN